MALFKRTPYRESFPTTNPKTEHVTLQKTTKLLPSFLLYHFEAELGLGERRGRHLCTAPAPLPS